VYYFRAVGTGTTTVTVPLSKAWLGQHRNCGGIEPCPSLSDLRVAVTVIHPLPDPWISFPARAETVMG